MPSRLASRSLREPEGKSRARARARGIEESFQTATSSRGVVSSYRIYWAQLELLRPISFYCRRQNGTRGSTAKCTTETGTSAGIEKSHASQARRRWGACHAIQSDGRQADQREPNASPPGREIGHQGHGHRVHE